MLNNLRVFMYGLDTNGFLLERGEVEPTSTTRQPSPTPTTTTSNTTKSETHGHDRSIVPCDIQYSKHFIHIIL